MSPLLIRRLRGFIFQIAGAQDGRFVSHLRTASQSGDPGAQLAEGEGLDEVIVRSRIQPLDPVTNAAERREKQDGCTAFCTPQRLDQTDTVQARQHSIDDHDVLGADAGLNETVLSRLQQIDRVSFRPQAVHDIGCGRPVVLDDQYLHCISWFPDRRCPERIAGPM